MLVLSIIGCSEDDEETTPPKIIDFRVNGELLGDGVDSGNHSAGAALNFAFTAVAGDGELETYTVEVYSNGVTDEETFEIDGQNFDVAYEYIIPTDATGTITITFYVNDSKDMVVSRAYMINVMADNPPYLTEFTIDGEDAMDQSSGMHMGGATVQFGFTAEDDNDLASYRVLGPDSTILKEEIITGTSASGSLDYVVNVSHEVGSEIPLTFIIVDDMGLEYSHMYTIIVDGQIDSYSITLGSYENYIYGSFFAALTADGMVYTKDEAEANQEEVDIVYFYGDTYNATLASPADDDAITVYNIGGWAILNETLLHESLADFDNIGTALQVKDAYDNAAGASKVFDLGTPDVIAFKTVDDKYGLLKITDVIAGAAGTIAFEVKVMQ
jgi:hypothetical protein